MCERNLYKVITDQAKICLVCSIKVDTSLYLHVVEEPTVRRVHTNLKIKSKRMNYSSTWPSMSYKW